MRKPYIVTKVFTLSNITKMSGEQQAAEGLPLRNVRWELMDLFLPEVGFWMAERGVDEISREELLHLISDRRMEPVPEWHWTVYPLTKDRNTMPFIREMSVERILEELEAQMKLLVMVEDGVYEFCDPDYLSYFAGLGLNYRLVHAAKLFEEMKEVSDEAKKAELVHQIVEKLGDFESRPWSKDILQHCGCQFEIPRSCPKEMDDGWIQDKTWVPEFDTVMDLFRRVPENPVMAEILEKRSCGHRKTRYYAEQNLGTILRQCRMKGVLVDFTGIDFHGIDLTHVDLSETVFGRKREGKAWYANLENTGFESVWN